MEYESDSQRFRSTSRQRSEQNGREPSLAGLPQIGQPFLDLLEGFWPGAGLSGLAGIQPPEPNRKTFAAEQSDRLVQRQTDDVGIGADHLHHERSGNALDGVATGFAAPFAGADIGLDIILAQPFEANAAFDQALPKCLLGRHKADRRVDTMVASRQQPQALR